MSKRQDRETKRYHLRHLPNPMNDPIASACNVVIVSFEAPIPDQTFCHYCRTVIATTRDHIVPKAKRGTDAWWNLVPACEPCNRRKSGNDTTCHCAYCTRAVFLFELGHMRPAKSPRSVYFETPKKVRRVPRQKRELVSNKELFKIKAPPLPTDLSTPPHLELPPSFPGST